MERMREKQDGNERDKIKSKANSYDNILGYGGQKTEWMKGKSDRREEGEKRRRN